MKMNKSLFRMSNTKRNLIAASALLLSYGRFAGALPVHSQENEFEARSISSVKPVRRIVQNLGSSESNQVVLKPSETRQRQLKRGKRMRFKKGRGKQGSSDDSSPSESSKTSKSSSSKSSKSSSSKTSKSSKSSKASKKSTSTSSDSSEDVADVFDLLAERDDEFSTFLTAAALAGLDAELMEQRRHLQSNSDVTVFIPTNDAFDAAGDAITRYFDTNIWSASFIYGIVSYHIIEGSVVLSTNLVDGQTVITSPSLIPDDVTVSLTDPPTLDGPTISAPANIIEFDNSAANGVFHVIDQVLTPGFLAVDVIMAAAGNDDFSNFFELIVAADLTTFLQGDGPFHVFGVPNAVFDGYQAALTAAGLNIDFLQMLKDDPDLVTIVQNHIIQGQIICGCTVDSGGSFTSVANNELVVSDADPTAGTYVVNGVTRIQGFIVRNAAIGVIDDFLFPPGLPTFLN